MPGRKEISVPPAEEGLVELQTRLGDWLHLTLQASLERPRSLSAEGVRAFTWVSLGFLALSGGLAVYVNPWFALLGLLVPAAGMVLLRPVESKNQSDFARQADAVQGQARALLRKWPLLDPPAWSLESVSELRHEIIKILGQAALRDERNQLRDNAQRALNGAQVAYASWARGWDSAMGDLGLRADESLLEGAPFFHFSVHLWHWLELMEKVGKAEAEYLTCLGQEAQLVEKLHGFLRANACCTPSREYWELFAQAKQLLERRAQAVLLLREEKGVQEQCRHAERRLDGLQTRMDTFWRDRGFQEADPERLVASSAKVETWARIKRELELATVKWTGLKAELGTHDPGGDLEHLQQEEVRLMAEAELIADWSEALGKQKSSFEHLLNGNELANALKERNEAEASLLQLREENLVSRVVDLVAKRLEVRASLEDQPAVLQKANIWLGRFTQARYQLGIDSKAEFFAYDTTKAENFPLDALSSGTRVQLLFAVRLAFIDELEGPDGVRLPLFLDEVLANSDDERAKAIIQAMVEIASERQVFYFTAQADELGKLQALAGPGGLHEVPLGRLAQDHDQVQFPLLNVVFRQLVVPDPVADYLEYGRLCGVSGASLFDPLESLHAWHLFTNSEDLHPFLQRGFARLGQVKHGVHAEESMIHTRLSLVARAQDLAQIGRGRPLALSDLEEADLPFLSKAAAYWDALLKVAEQSGGDALAFKRSWKDIARLKQDIKDSLESWLIEHGFLPFQGTVSMASEAILERLHRDFPWLKLESDDRVVVERFTKAVLGEH